MSPRVDGIACTSVRFAVARAVYRAPAVTCSANRRTSSRLEVRMMTIPNAMNRRTGRPSTRAGASSVVIESPVHALDREPPIVGRHDQRTEQDAQRAVMDGARQEQATWIAEA